MNAKEWLSRSLTIDRELARLNESRETMIAKLTKATQTITGDVVQSSKDPHAFDRLGELAEKIEKDTRELDRVLAEIHDVIMEVEQPLPRLVLIERYINLKRFERIAVDNNFSIRNVWRIHGRALRLVEEVLNARR